MRKRPHSGKRERKDLQRSPVTETTGLSALEMLHRRENRPGTGSPSATIQMESNKRKQKETFEDDGNT